jgi:hypothetical protein
MEASYGDEIAIALLTFGTHGWRFEERSRYQEF